VSVIDTRAEDAIHSLDNAIATLAQESADWRVVVANLEKDISKDVQSTIRTEVQDLARTAILSAGAEFRCNAEFMRIRLRSELIHIRNSLVQSINAEIEKTPFTRYEIPLLPEDALEPFICDVVPAGVDLSLDPERRTKIDIYGFDLRSLPITVGFSSYGIYKPTKQVTVKEFAATMLTRTRVAMPVKVIQTDAFQVLEPSKVSVTDMSNALSFISDFHAVLDLTESGAQIPPNAREIVLSWKNQVRSEIPILTHEKTMDCNTTDTLIYPGSDTFIPPAVEHSPYGGNPDKDFNGNGPCVTFHLTLNLDPARKVLSATYYMDAWECPDDFSKIHKDYTEAVGSKTITLFTAAEDETILSYNVQSVFDDQYIDTDTKPDIRYFGGLSPVEKIEYTGDTDGDEAGTKTGATVTFRLIKLQIQRCQYQ
jgi:hypothetical protein